MATTKTVMVLSPDEIQIVAEALEALAEQSQYNRVAQGLSEKLTAYDHHTNQTKYPDKISVMWKDSE